VNPGAEVTDEAAPWSLLVEFCGLPGAGKSHVSAALMNQLRRRGIPARAGDAWISPRVPAIRRIPRKLRAATRQAFDDPTGAARAGLAVARAERSAGDVVCRSLQWFVTQHVLGRAAGRAGVHVFQEGVVQALWSIGVRGDPDGLLAVLEAGATPWIRPDVLVVVSAPIEVAAARLGERGSSHSRTQALPPDERASELRRGQELLGCLVEWWRVSSGGGEIVEVANGDDGPRDREAAHLVDRILARLEALGRNQADRGGIAIPS
jgi:thymidylate kinase